MQLLKLFHSGMVRRIATIPIGVVALSCSANSGDRAESQNGVFARGAADYDQSGDCKAVRVNSDPASSNESATYSAIARQGLYNFGWGHSAAVSKRLDFDSGVYAARIVRCHAKASAAQPAQLNSAGATGHSRPRAGN